MEAVAGAGPRRRAAIRRISEGRSRWRVEVESWREHDAYRGRLLFCPDAHARELERQSAVLLQGRSHEDVLLLAHDLPEDRLRRVLNSLV